MKISVYFLFAIIILYSLYQIFVVDKRSFSINKFIWFYVLMFWGIASLVQFSVAGYMWDVAITNFTALKSNILILIFLVSYGFAYKIVLKTDTIDQDTYKTSKFTINKSGIALLLITQFLLFIFFYIRSGGFIMLRGESSEIEVTTSQPVSLLIEQVGRALSAFLTYLFFWYYRQEKSKSNLFLFVLSFTLLLFTSFPLAIARYMAGAFYIGLLFIAKPVYKKRSLPIYALLFIFLFIFPLLTFVRYITTLSDMEGGKTITESLTSGDFDNFSTLNMAVLHVENHGLTYGNQLLGTLLFFVPRSIWPSKPIGSGQFMAIARNLDFTNISCPLVAEGYLNFGYLGVVLFALIIGFVAAKLDYSFYHNKRLSIMHLFYPMALGQVIFILRGDLMSSWAYTVSFIVAAIMIFNLAKPFITYQDNIDPDNIDK